jgi:hypothetical protein
MSVWNEPPPPMGLEIRPHGGGLHGFAIREGGKAIKCTQVQ